MRSNQKIVMNYVKSEVVTLTQIWLCSLDGWQALPLTKWSELTAIGGTS